MPGIGEWNTGAEMCDRKKRDGEMCDVKERAEK